MLDLIIKLSPIYLYILIGFLAGKFFSVDKKSINSLLLYIILPFVIFNFLYKIELNKEVISFPIFIYILVSLIATIVFFVSKLVYKEKEFVNITAFNASSSNFGYFGLSAALILLSAENAKYYSILIPTLLLHQFTIGIFFDRNW